MCGIGGVMFFPKERTKQELEYIKYLTENILVENQDRGKDASGIASFNKDNAYSLAKHHVRASTFVETDFFREFVKNNINATTKSILLHARASTKGAKENNANNHPIETSRFIGVHNGVIWNDDALFSKYKLNRQGQVDSEVIFRLMDTMTSEEPTKEEVKKVAEILMGMFTVAFVNKNNNRYLYLVKKDNPVTLAYLANLNIVIFASKKAYLDNAILETNGIFMRNGVYTAINSVHFVEPKPNTIWVFDTEKNNPLEQLNQKPLGFYENEYDYSFYYNGYSAYNYEEDSYWDNKHLKTKTYDAFEDITDFSFIEKYLNDDELLLFYEKIALLKDRMWNEGFTDGRASISKKKKYAY